MHNEMDDLIERNQDQIRKLAMGLKIEGTQKPSYQTEEEYEQSI